MSAPIGYYNMLAVLARFGELIVVVGGREFHLVQDGVHVVACINCEQHRFSGCSEQEIKDILAEYRSGTWR